MKDMTDGSLFTAYFWKGALERAIRTYAQALFAILVGGMIVTDGAQWIEALLSSAVAALLSVLTSIIASGAGDKGTPSFVKESQPPQENADA